MGIKDREGMIIGFTSVESNEGDGGKLERVFDTMNIDIVDKVSSGDNTFIIEEIDGEND